MKEEIGDIKISFDKAKEFWNHPSKHLPIDKGGDLYLQWFTDRYAALRLLQRIPIFDRAYAMMKERKNFSRKTAFGEMHPDTFMWIEKDSKHKVIVLQCQSNMYVFVRERYEFHVRELLSKYTYPSYRKQELKGCTLEAYRKIGFHSSYDNTGVFQYGDARDEGYLGSTSLLIKGEERTDNANARILFAIGLMDYWLHYLDNPEELE